jgi:para-aminobenzoate synthetase / 4-amino-4-deoxychorismate lyase
MTCWHPLTAELLRLVGRTPETILLECARGELARPGARSAQSESAAADSYPYSRVFITPLRVSIAWRMEDLGSLFEEIETAIADGMYAAGYFTYECGELFEPVAAGHRSHPDQPLAWFGFYNRVYLFDHLSGTFVDSEPPGLGNAGVDAEAVDFQDASVVESTLSLISQQYAERIATIKEWIRRGDVYQLNFTAPLRINAPGCSAALYARLAARQPGPCNAFLHWQPGRRILSFSPELFFSLDSRNETRRIETRPMKGTAPRGRTAGEDNAQAEWLRSDPKNRAENVMIVDLLRNDLGRLCAFGTVRAKNLFTVERYPTLLQMTSTITGELRPEVGFAQIFRALFPCGSITGAPKVRAMQLIAELEDEPRGVYTGAIGFFSKEKSVFSVAIRTLELDGENGKMGIGSGIVIDSDAGEEFRECLLKAEFLTRSAEAIPESVSLVETMLWQKSCPLIELHLDRLADSATYFAFPFDRAVTRAELLEHAGAFGDERPRKVRMLLHSDGSLHIASELIPESADGKPVRVSIARERTDPRDPMLFHKTTHRPLYARALAEANQAGMDDVLFLNIRGEITEGAIHNVFVERDGRWFTPPIECGVLPGVYRRHILETRPNVEERVLHLEDLAEADAIYLSNAVRCLRPAIIDWEAEVND